MLESVGRAWDFWATGLLSGGWVIRVALPPGACAVWRDLDQLV